MYWFKERCYETLAGAINAYEEYKKNERILNGEGLAPLPRNLNFHNHYQEVVPGVIEEVSAYDTLGNKIATWTAYKSTAAKDITNCHNCGAPSQIVGFGPPDIPDAPIGTIYVDMANDCEYKMIAAKDNKIITNCRNCGAPVYGYRCEYCDTHY